MAKEADISKSERTKKKKRALKGVQKKTAYLTLLCLGCILLVSSLVFTRPGFVQRMDRGIYDVYLKEMAGGEPSSIPVLIDIDEKSLNEYGQWPWPRYLTAELLAALHEYGVLSIGVDILMQQPDRTSPVLLAENLRRDFGVEPEVVGLPPELMDNDGYMASVLEQIPVVMAAQVTARSEDEATSIPRSFPITEVRAPGAPGLHEFLPDGPGILMPVPQIAQKLSVIGLMNAEGDSDSIFRRVPLFLSWNNVPIAGLSLATLALAAGDKSVVTWIDKDGPKFVKVAGIDIPISHEGTMPVAFRGGGGVYPIYSALDVLTGEVPPEKLAGKIAFVGSTTVGLKDLRPTPFDKNYPGLELHAAAVDTILSERFIREPTWLLGVELIMIFVTGTIVLVLFSSAKPQVAFPAGVAMAAAVWFGCRYSMLHGGIYVTPLYSLLSIFLQAFSAFSMRFWLEEREKWILRKAFSNYVSPEIVGRIVESGSIDSLGGEQRNISVLFTDLRGFTSLTEKMLPTQVVEMLGGYFTPMTAIVRGSMGTLDKFVGDALMAFWNAPIDVPDHPLKAVQALMDMHSALDELNRVNEPEFGLRLRMGGGIHTGPAHVGNMGTIELMNYTAIGDTVNTASRMEGMCSKYGVGTVVSQNTADGCGGRFAFKPLDIVRLKGRSAGIKIFTVLSLEEADEADEELYLWDEAFGLYVAGDFESSNRICLELLERHPEKMLYQIFVERTENMAKVAKVSEMTPDSWDGVFTYESK